jgi:4-alpha-glucanotransferase
MLHFTCLPSPYGIGDLGPSAHQFIDFLHKANFHFWQVLPTNPTSPSLGNSPYTAFSTFAGNELLISPDLMLTEGFIDLSDLQRAHQAQSSQVDFDATIHRKGALIDLAFQRALGALEHNDVFERFCLDNASWLNDYSFFIAAKDAFGGVAWTDWPADLADRDDGALAKYGTKFSKEILRVKFGQFLFFSQLGRLKQAAKEKGVGLIGDTAFYVNHDSSDVWSHRELFSLNDDGTLSFMAGVPPDYFAKTGQLWGNPIYDWSAHQKEGYRWWKGRILHNLGLFDWVRLDHFRAFSAFWSVEPRSKTAQSGSWRPCPGAELFETVMQGRDSLNIIAEDLGVITPDVTDLRRRFGFPGMRVLQFGFGSDQPLSSHTPFRIPADNLVYSATHDNNTTKGWYEHDLDDQARERLTKLAGWPVTADDAAEALVRLAYLSPAALCVVTVQDLLNLGQESRLNTPGTAKGNWGYRLNSLDDLSPHLADALSELGQLSGRDNYTHPNILTYEN